MPDEAREGAAVEGTTTEAPSVPFADALQGGLGHTLVQMGGAVVLVVALILVLQKLAGRYRIGWAGRSRDGGIDILSQRALGNRLSLLVVETHGQTFLLGTSPQGIQPLATLATSTSTATSTATSGATSAATSAQVSAATLAASRFAVTSAPTSAASTSAASASAASTSAATLATATSAAAQAASGAVPPVAHGRTATVPIEASPAKQEKSGGSLARGALRSMARAVSRRPADAPRSALADLEEAARIARETRAREDARGAETVGEAFDLQGFESEFREKLRAIREKYPTLEEAEGRRA